MAGENDQVVEPELTPEQEAEADAEFEAAFNKARGDEPDAERTTPTPAPTEAPETGEQSSDDQAAADAAAKAEADAAAAAQAQADAEAQAKAQAEAEANAPATITKAELDALRAVAASVGQLQEELKRTKDTTAGRLGSIQQTIEAVKAQAQNGQRPTLGQMKRLGQEFPELAALLKEDLEEAFGAGGATAPEGGTEVQPEPTAAPAPAPQPADPFTDPRVQQTLRQKEIAIVDAAHPDWRDLKATPEFNEWRNSLPPAAQHALANSWDATVLNGAFDEFKGWKKKRAEQAATTNQRNKRLEHGTPATTGQPTGNNAVDDDAAFLDGFKSARGS